MSKNQSKDIKPLTKKEWIRFVLSLIGLSLMVILFIWLYNNQKKEEKLLNKYGQETFATTIKTHWRKRGTEVKYFYLVNNKKYESWKKIPVEKGEKIKIVVPNGTYKLIYYPKNPKIHRIELNEFVYKN